VPAAAQRLLTANAMSQAAALGRIVAHEIGHHLLGSRQHSEFGLMRAQFPLAELQGMRPGPFLLTQSEEVLLASTWLTPPVCTPPRLRAADRDEDLASGAMVQTFALEAATPIAHVVNPVYAAKHLAADQLLLEGNPAELFERLGPPEAVQVTTGDGSTQIETMLFTNMRLVLVTRGGAVAAWQAAVRGNDDRAFGEAVKALTARLGTPSVDSRHRVAWALAPAAVEIVGDAGQFNLTVHRRTAPDARQAVASR
jgi:hypothetical protein